MSLQQKNAESVPSSKLPQPEIAGSGRGGLPPATKILIWLACAILTLAPIFNISYVLATTGADNLCNDYLQYVGLIDRMLSGNYNWLTYISDTFYRTHSVALPVLIHLADARFFHWSIYPELATGVVLAILRLALLQATLGSTLSGWRKMALCPALALLIFSTSQMSVFCYGDGALTIELSLLGFALGLWGITTCKNETLASLSMLAGGLVASYSWGNGLVTWMVFFAGLVVGGRRKPAPYIVWATGLALSLFPYIQALVISRLTHAGPERAGTSIVSFFNWHFFINALGWPLANDLVVHAEGLRQAKTCGWLGLILAGAALAIIARSRRSDLRLACIPALLCMLHGAISIWQISVFRTLIASWYTAVAATFWMGLVALVPVLYERLRSENEPTQTTTPLLRKVGYIWCAAVLLSVGWAYFNSNLTYEDKTDLLFSRSPASASALRHYLDGPTYREAYVFQWGSGNPGLIGLMAAPLAKDKLSVFAPHQIWTLQGDYLLDTVKLSVKNKDRPALWTAALSEKERLPWSHHKHLNLLLPTPDAVSWTVTVPQNCSQAEFKSAVALGSLSGSDAGVDPISFELHVKAGDAPEKLAFNSMTRASNRIWHDFNCSLTEYKGQTITLRLSGRTLSKQNGIPAVFKYPYIEVDNTDSPAANSGSPAPSAECPSNTELSPLSIRRTSRDLELGVTSNWHITPQPAAVNQPLVLPVQPHVSLSYASPLSVKLSDYSHFMITVSENAGLTPRAVTVSLYLDNAADATTFTIPLLANEYSHSYTYDLKLLGLAPTRKITGIKLDLSDPAKSRAGDQVVVSDFRFVKTSD